jgi:hypothetical protein
MVVPEVRRLAVVVVVLHSKTLPRISNDTSKNLGVEGWKVGTNFR